MGNPVYLPLHNSCPFPSAISLSSQVSSSRKQNLLARPYCGSHWNIDHKISYNSISGIHSKVLRPYICSSKEDVCRKLSIRRTGPAPSCGPVTGSKGVSSRGRFMIKSQNGDAKNEDDAREATFQASIEKSRKLLALQRQLLEKIAERRKLVSTLKDNLGSSADKSKMITETFGFQENQGLTNTEKNRDMQSVRTNTEQRHLDENEKMPKNSTTEAAEFLPKDSGSLSTVPENDDMQLLGEEKKTEEKFASVEIGQHSGMEKVKRPPLAGPNVMNIIMVGAECVPWSKTGGLGDVVGALPKALARRGHRVMAVVPRYSEYTEAWDTGIHMCYNVAGQDMDVGYFHGYIDGVDYIFIDNYIFHGVKDSIYEGSHKDILKRMILFCKAAVEVPWHVPCGGVRYGDGNLVFVANDWHTALVPVYLKAYYHDHGLMKYTRCVLVIHNIAHQGRGPLDDYHLLTLPDHYLEKFMLYDPIGGAHLNIFMAGLKTAHRLVAVSHGYAWECQTQEGGWGLHDVVKENAWKLRGIVNGIDNTEWNPEFDDHLKSDGYVNYSLNTLETGKATCKSALQRELGLPVRSNVPLISFIGRLDQQKGVDLIAEAMPWMMEQDVQLVMLGTGRKDLEDMLHSFEAQYPDKVRGWVGFSVRISRRITAGADIILMPSRFEPCGLNQLYAMQYGTIPVVHAVGGLRDTVQPFNPFVDCGLGWTFEPAEASALIYALGNALRTYRDFKQSWRALQKRCMSQDLSWDNAAQQYEEVFVDAKYQW